MTPERITASHEVMLGKPVIKGTRLTVELLLRKLAEGATSADLLALYPQLEAEDVRAALVYTGLTAAQSRPFSPSSAA